MSYTFSFILFLYVAFYFHYFSLDALQYVFRRCYIRFIKKANEKKGFEGQEETRKAFEFMLNYVGKFTLLANYIFESPLMLDIYFVLLHA